MLEMENVVELRGSERTTNMLSTWQEHVYHVAGWAMFGLPLRVRSKTMISVLYK